MLKGDGSNVNKSIYRHICAGYRFVGMAQTWKGSMSFCGLIVGLAISYVVSYILARAYVGPGEFCNLHALGCNI